MQPLDQYSSADHPPESSGRIHRGEKPYCDGDQTLPQYRDAKAQSIRDYRHEFFWVTIKMHVPSGDSEQEGYA